MRQRRRVHPIGVLVQAPLQRAMMIVGRSARDVSLGAGLGSTAVRDILNGKSADPSIGTLAALADEIGVPVESLIERRAPRRCAA